MLGAATCPVATTSPRPGWVELAPDQVWRATLEAVGAVLAQSTSSHVTALGVTTERDTTVLWDVETLGSPRAALAATDRRTPGAGLAERLRWLSGAEPHTWALVEEGTYAVGTLDSYLVARMTRGTWHLSDVSHASGTGLLDLGSGRWSDERCRAAGVPEESLAELVPTWGGSALTEPRTFLGLAVPVATVVARSSASRVGSGLMDAGTVVLTVGAAGTTAVGLAGETTEATALAWGSPEGVLTGAVERSCTATSATDAADLVRGLPGAPSSVLVVGAGDGFCQEVAGDLGVVVERAGPLSAALGAARLAGLGAGRSPADLGGVPGLADGSFSPRR